MDKTKNDASAYTGLGAGGLIGAFTAYALNAFAIDFNVATLYAGISIVKNTAILLTPPCTAQLLGNARMDFAKAAKYAGAGSVVVGTLLFGLGQIDEMRVDHMNPTSAPSLLHR